MPISFPTSPSTDDEYTFDGKTWTFNGFGWARVGSIELIGPAGDDGVGVPAGGTTGQLLAKTSGTDYATEWADPASGITVSATAPASPTTGQLWLDIS